MNRRQMIKILLHKELNLMLFALYYFLVSTLCWTLVSEELGVTMQRIVSNGIWVNFLYWGAINGVFLCISGMLMGVFALSSCLYKHRWKVALQCLIDAVICFSIVVVPYVALEHNLAIRQAMNPILIVLLSGLFLFTVTQHYYRIMRRARHTLSMITLAALPSISA